jgi:hypothetical protein
MGSADEWQDFGPDDPKKLPFEEELALEVGRGHELFGLDMTVVSRRLAQDDVIVTAAGRTGCAAVHLTFARGRETPPWPRTAWYESVDEAKASLAEG